MINIMKSKKQGFDFYLMTQTLRHLMISLWQMLCVSFLFQQCQTDDEKKMVKYPRNTLYPHLGLQW